MTAQVATVPAINPLPSPLSPKKRKGTPHRSPKATTDSDLTAVFITFPFITHTRDPADTAVKTKKQVRMNLGPSTEQRTDATTHLRRPSEKFPEPSTNNTNTITTTAISQSTTPLSRSSTNANDQASSALHARQISVKANVRFVGDSFYGSNRYWWTRAIRPSPALSTSSSDAGSPTGQDDGKDAEYDSFGNARGPESTSLERSPQSSGRGRGGRGRGGRGRGRGGRGRGGWAKKL